MRLTRWSIPIFTAAILLAGSAVWRAGAQNGSSATGRIAVVDIPKLLEQMEERPVKENNLKTFIEEQNKQLKALGERLERALGDLELEVKGSQAHRRKSEEVARLRVDLEIQGRWSDQLIDRRRAEMFADLFEKMQSGTAHVAAQLGYDMVMSSDATGAVPRDSEPQIRGMIGSRRIMYVSPSIDITDAVVRYLNNQWNAGRAANAER